MNRLLFLTILLTFTKIVSAQFQLQLIDNLTTQPIVNASVNYEWINPNNQVKNKHLSITNTSGICEIEEDAIKNLAIFSISHPQFGIVTFTTYQVIKNNYKLHLNNTLSQLDEVTISANKTEEKTKDISRVIESIKINDITFSNNQNTADLLLNQSNVYMQKSQQGGGSPIIRGFEANRVLLVVDGVRLNNAIFRAGHLQNVIRVDQNILQKAEVLYGAGSVIYGSDALGGVVNFVTKKPQLNTGSKKVHLTNQLFSRYSSGNNELTYHYDVNIGVRKWASLTSITHSNFGNVIQGKNRDAVWENVGLRQSFVQRLDNKDVIVKNPNNYEQIGSNYTQTDFTQKIIFKPNIKQQHLLNFQYSISSNVPRYDRLTEVDNNDTPTSAQWYYGPEMRLLASYNFTYFTNKTWFEKISTTVAYQQVKESRNDRKFNNLNLRSRNEEVHIFSINTDVFKHIKKHEIRYGYEVQHNIVNSSAYQTNINTLLKSPLSTRYPEGGSTLTNVGVFISHNFEINDKFILNDGARYSLINTAINFGKSLDFYSFLPQSINQQNMAINGNIGLIYLINKSNRIFANISNAYHAPNIDDLSKVFDSDSKSKMMIIPNQNLKPEKSITAEFGTNLTLFKNLQLNGSLYYTKLYDAIVISPTQINGNDSAIYDGQLSKVNTLTNKQEAYIWGYSLNGKYKLTQKFSIYGSYTYTKGKIQQNGLTPLDHIPPTYGRLGATILLKGFMFDTYTQFSGAKKLGDYNINGEDNLKSAPSTGTPAWYTLNTKAQFSRYKRGVTYTLQTGVENILDTHYRLFASGISAVGRNVYVTLRLTF
ncbi:MAG: TonB-dependent receptor [Bacteroidia bacterium]|nr:TonB-dependent receptor [Bacteroidia bacterium]